MIKPKLNSHYTVRQKENFNLSKIFLCTVHVGADLTEIQAKNGFRFVDPYVKKTILNLNGSVWYVNPETINAFTVAGDSLVTHRVS